MISVVILTKNEEIDIVDCVRSVSWSDDVHVFDSLSTDETVSLAQAAGAQVHQRPFDNYSAQRNAALQLPLKYGWVFFLDADERCTLGLQQEMLDAVRAAPENVTAYRMNRHDYFLGRHLKRTMPTTTYVRLLRLGACHYEREIHEQMITTGDIVDLNGYFDHYPFSKGVDPWYMRHTQYATLEAKEIVGDTTSTFFGVLGQIIRPTSRDVRWRAIKRMTYMLPGRRYAKFFFMYVVKRGFLDGYPGFLYCQMLQVYERMIDMKITYMRVARRDGRG